MWSRHCLGGASRKDSQIPQVRSGSTIADHPIRFTTDEGTVRDTVDVDAPGYAVPSQICLRENVVIVEFLELDLLAKSPVSSTLKRQ